MQRDTYTIDAAGKVLGRLAADIAQHLVGKHKPSFETHLDVGDVVVVTNVAQMKITGDQVQKVYYHHTMHPGGIKAITQKALVEKDPAKVLFLAVSRMLPKNHHRKTRLQRLRIS